MNKLNYEILSAIDNIETTVMESEMNVINSLMNSYGKALMILECYDDINDTSLFDIFQESVIMEADDKTQSSKSNKTSLLSKLINLFKRAIERLKELLKPIREKINKVLKSVKDKLGLNCQIKVVCDFKKITSTLIKSLNEYFQFFNGINTKDIQTTESIKKLKPSVETLVKLEDIDKVCDRTKEVINDFTNNNKFEMMNCNKVLDSFDKLGKIVKECLDSSNAVIKELDNISIKLLNGVTPEQFIHNTDNTDVDITYYNALSELSQMMFDIHNKKIYKSFTVYSDLVGLILSPSNIEEIR